MCKFHILQNFDFNKYYTVRIDGASGSGKITNYQNPEFPLETANSNTEKPKKEEEFAKEGGITFNFSKTEGIQNGDTIDVEVSYNKDVAKKLKIRPQNSKFKIKVNGLLEYAKNANQVKDLKNYITKLAQRKIELQKMITLLKILIYQEFITNRMKMEIYQLNISFKTHLLDSLEILNLLNQ